jgi:aspartyl-tRNA(Asn)/glutamyl-tRNA(Gln) amidotransferase subunit A
MYLVDIDTVVANLAGNPAISVPAGFSTSNSNSNKALPVGLQFMADDFSEQLLLDAAYTFESVANVQKRSPDL